MTFTGKSYKLDTTEGAYRFRFNKCNPNLLVWKKVGVKQRSGRKEFGLTHLYGRYRGLSLQI